ncbi:MAG: hypothetical protein FWD69_18245 [Polyangiaceae bacterium]|nr:hypothetical protein [Polyangiaceae bacterium]
MLNSDVIVLAPDRPDVTLVAEIKMSVADLRAAEQQLKMYMLDRRCPTALLVTPQKTWIYRDTYKDFTADSIVLEGEASTTELLGLSAEPKSGAELESSVRAWLERLAASWPSALPKAGPVRKPVVEHLVPAVSEGRVMSGVLFG